MPVASAVTLTSEPAAKCQTPPSDSYTTYWPAKPARARRVAVAAGSWQGSRVLAHTSGGTDLAHASQMFRDPVLIVWCLLSAAGPGWSWLSGQGS